MVHRAILCTGLLSAFAQMGDRTNLERVGKVSMRRNPGLGAFLTDLLDLRHRVAQTIYPLGLMFAHLVHAPRKSLGA